MKSVTCCLFLLSCIVGCVSDPLPIDGTWNMVLTLGAGTCAPPGRTQMVTTIVVLDDDTYRFQFSPPEPEEEVSGSTRCSEDRCDVNITIVDREGSNTVTTETYDVEIDSDLVIRGTGTITVTGAAPCTQSVTLAGTIF